MKWKEIFQTIPKWAIVGLVKKVQNKAQNHHVTITYNILYPPVQYFLQNNINIWESFEFPQNLFPVNWSLVNTHQKKKREKKKERSGEAWFPPSPDSVLWSFLKRDSWKPWVADCVGIINSKFDLCVAAKQKKRKMSSGTWTHLVLFGSLSQSSWINSSATAT